MEDKAQQSAKERWENEGGKPAAQPPPTAGDEIPVPRSSTLRDAVKKALQPPKPKKP